MHLLPVCLPLCSHIPWCSDHVTQFLYGNYTNATIRCRCYCCCCCLPSARWWCCSFHAWTSSTHLLYIFICTQIDAIHKFQSTFLFELSDNVFNIIWAFLLFSIMIAYFYYWIGRFCCRMTFLLCHSLSPCLSHTLTHPSNRISKIIEIAVKQLPDCAISLIDFHFPFASAFLPVTLIESKTHVSRCAQRMNRKKIGISLWMLCRFFFFFSSSSFSFVSFFMNKNKIYSKFSALIGRRSIDRFLFLTMTFAGLKELCFFILSRVLPERQYVMSDK